MAGRSAARGGLVLLLLVGSADALHAQAADQQQSRASRASSTVRFLAGAASALVMHEGGHLAFDLAFDAEPRIKRVEFHGIPFFAITHRHDVTRRQRFVIASSGFWVQHATNEWVLTRSPDLRAQPAAFRKGMVAFNVLASAAYAGAAFARTGPVERDTLGMAAGARMDERWIGALILAPAALDTVRYFKPDAKWAVWTSRAVKVGTVLLVFR